MKARDAREPARKGGGSTGSRTRRPAASAKSAPAAQPSRPQTPPEPPVLIDLEPVVSGGFMNGRLDLTVRGRVAGQGVEELVLQRDDVDVSRMQVGESDQRAMVRLPDGTLVPQQTFQLTLPLPADVPFGVVRCGLQARSAEARTHAVRFGIMVDPAAVPPGHVVAGPLTPPGAVAGLHPPVILFVERAALDLGGTLTLHGWAVARTRIVTIQAFVGDGRVGSAKIGLERGDVGTVHPHYPDARSAGFALTTTLSAADRQAEEVRVQVICLGGLACDVVLPLERVRPAEPAERPAEAAAPQVFRVDAGYLLAAGEAGAADHATEASADPRRAIKAYCDEAVVGRNRVLTVNGWAVSAVGIAHVEILIDGTLVGEAEAGHPRPDVGEEFATIPMARYAGYRFAQPLPDLEEGDHTLRIVVRNGLDDTHQEDFVISVGPPEPVAAGPVATGMEPDPQVFRFELDSPTVRNGAVPDPVSGRLTIEGWVLARAGIEGIEVLLDGQRLGNAHYGLARQDVGLAFPEWQDSLRSGYAFHCPPRVLKDGPHQVQLVVRAKDGQEHLVRFDLTVKKADETDESATIRRRVTRAETDLVEGMLRDLGCRPALHLVIRDTPELVADRLLRTLESLRRQAYPEWRATILVQAEDAPAVRDLLAGSEADLAPRIEVIAADDPRWEAPLVPAGDGRHLAGLLHPGDELGADALGELALAAALHPEAAFIYADETRQSPASGEREAFFKPDWSPDLLLSTNYVGRPWVASTALLREIGVTPRSLAEAGEYDLVLQATERAAEIHHLPKLLAARGPVAGDPDTLDEAALVRAAARRGTPAEVLPGWGRGTWRLKRTAPVSGKVSIIIPTCAAKGHVETCLTTLRERTRYRNYEIVCIDNIPDTEMRWKAWLLQNADKVVDIPEAFNWSRFNNVAAAACDGEFLLFLNDDVEIVEGDWLDALLEHAARPEVGIVGPQLLYPDGKVQHAGMFLGGGIGRHAFRFAARDEPGYFGLALTQRNVIAVTGACMLVRREVFERIGRFDELHTIVNNDLDFCLRAHAAGLRTVFTPHASLIHHELASRDRLQDVFDASQFSAQWRTLFAAGDPYYSPMLFRHADDVRPDDEPVQVLSAGHPLFRREDVKRLLVVKLDHIGDFVTALPPIRRLKELFPEAEITVLAGRASEAFLGIEPAIDRLIPFDFFHARSQLGERDLTAEDFLALQAELAPYRFDLAIDLRKHASTRDVLRYTGARWLAGFDYMGQFPFLDIALEWDGDKSLQRKRSHVVDDLLSLVEAVGNATNPDRRLIQPQLPAPSLDLLPESVQPLFERHVVAVHAGAGNVTKQWPAAYFAALIDLLIERDDVNVLLVGGPDDEAVSKEISGLVLRPERVGSLAGQTKLAALPRILAACAVYVGNDSGPKHIAGAIGVPTVGIHSGVVDAAEWAPIGERSVALRRNMSCSPCYLANAADCPRNLACLTQLEPALVHRTVQALLARPIRAAMPAIVPAAIPAPTSAINPATTQRKNGASDSMKDDPSATEPAATPAKPARAGKPARRPAAGDKPRTGRTGRRTSVPA
ncbi:MAG: hypothetical protein BGO51_24865 [Rhodospirillales bacterium 69-11]|nr:MAG: hypothetical protein BGO51_24865 [Rhodospirillales bacterium 69-11]